MPKPPVPVSVADALAQLDAAMDCLTGADWASLPTVVQAGALAALARLESRHVAARTAALAAFDAGNGYRFDGQAGPVSWLMGVTRVTKPAARHATAWLRRLSRHRRIAEALAGGLISVSWAGKFAVWNDRLPVADRDGADDILISAAVAGLPLDEIARLAQEMYERSRTLPDEDDAPFRDRRVLLERTFGGAGKLIGDLSPECAEIVQKIFDALGKRVGPDDLRSEAERNHDALAEAGRRLMKASMLPQSSGTDTKAMVYMSLSQLREQDGASEPGNRAGSPARAPRRWRAALR